MTSLLEVTNLQTHFPTRAGLVKAVNDVSFVVGESEFVGLVGESGCGKSITAVSIMRLIYPPGKITGGSIRFKGEELTTASAQRMREIRALQQRGVVHRRRKSWWEADHILAVVEGGDSNLENMRTLCIPCHREVTRALRARRLHKSRVIEEPHNAQNSNDLHFAGSDAARDCVQHESGDRQT